MINKQTILGVVLGAVVTLTLVAGTASAGIWDSITTSGWSTKDTTTKYLLDVKDYDVRVYEWTPADNPNVRMVFVAGNESSGVGSYVVK